MVRRMIYGWKNYYARRAQQRAALAPGERGVKIGNVSFLPDMGYCSHSLVNG